MIYARFLPCEVGLCKDLNVFCVKIYAALELFLIFVAFIVGG